MANMTSQIQVIQNIAYGGYIGPGNAISTIITAGTNSDGVILTGFRAVFYNVSAYDTAGVSVFGGLTMFVPVYSCVFCPPQTALTLAGGVVYESEEPKLVPPGEPVTWRYDIAGSGLLDVEVFWENLA